MTVYPIFVGPAPSPLYPLGNNSSGILNIFPIPIPPIPSISIDNFVGMIALFLASDFKILVRKLIISFNALEYFEEFFTSKLSNPNPRSPISN